MSKTILAFLIYALYSLAFLKSEAKQSLCRAKFPGGGDESKLWVYCTKFGVVKDGKLRANVKA